MFKKNKQHWQPPLISNVSQLPAKHRRRLEQSWAGAFYRDCFCRLKEEAFAVLYATVPSRPNVPVNGLVGLETLKAGFGWSDEELYDHFTDDVQVRYALGLHALGDGDFELRTLYNFRQRLSHYNQAEGVNLLAQAFADITDQQLSAFQVQPHQQRMDSTQIASNILDASRLQLLVDALRRISASCLQSLDDLEASYREKAGRAYTGYVANVSETCDPANPVQLLTSLQVAPNTTEDSQLMAAAVPALKARMPLETLHTDGTYASPAADAVLQAAQVDLQPTAIRGRQPDPAKLGLADFDLHVDAQQRPVQVTCPQGQTVPVRPGRTGVTFVADFDPAVCTPCSLHQAGRATWA